MMAKPIGALQLHFPIIQFLIMAFFFSSGLGMILQSYDSTEISSDNRSPDSKECFRKLSKISVSLHTVALR